MPSVLTDSARVAHLLDSAVTGTLDAHSAALQAIILHVNDAIERYLARTIENTAYTHYLDGMGTPTLELREGPLVSVTSVEQVDYIDSGGGARGETLETVDPYTYVEQGLRSEGYIGLGSLRMLSGVWQKGSRNYKVVYNAGWEPLDTGGSNDIPEAIVSQATREVAARFNTRSLDGLASRTVGDSTIDRDITTIPERFISEARKRALAPFRIPRVA